ncbi:hypothetical protein SCP_1400920 [Sparassis crispa]|uniref:Uncharacterized protein n=1 Tax=Sparassis crispa TaxID=139825 RepID=A0A401H2N1_9APHY|nr:hypothetical protein SCP_1400920 [Sparassis crispa]GBE88687.1 hypothetical protein SCP_1400920 [Sparassis crispa]
MSSRARSRPLAITTVVGTVATLGYMYVAGTQSKRDRAHDSIFKDSFKQAGNLKPGDSDVRMGSSAVRTAMHGNKKS